MPGLDLSQLSSNWKKLQGQLQTQKKLNGEKTGIKRKRPNEGQGRTNGHNKKQKTQSSHPILKHKNMGVNSSKPVEQTSPLDNTHSKLAQDHDIKPEDISAAYHTPNGALNKGLHEYTDSINSGLHPTNRPGKYIALDCEMVGTGPPPYTDNVLARASLVNFHGEQIYDSYVFPPPGIEVKDYRTFVSGIKEEHLSPGFARSYEEVREDITELLRGRILVGHALRNDILVLQLHTHPKRDLRDTSRHPPFREKSGGRPPALRVLARRELGLEIQT